jgi:hypothetical protein
LVDPRNPAAVQELTRQGATPLVDYAAFALWSVPEAQAPALLSRPGITAYDYADTLWLRGAALDTRSPPPSGRDDVPAALRQARSAAPQF